MGIGVLLGEYGPPMATAAIVLLVLMALFYLLSRLNVASDVWNGIRAHAATTVLLSLTLLFGIGLITHFERVAHEDAFRQREEADLLTPTNLIADPLFTSIGPVTSTLHTWVTGDPQLRGGTVTRDVVLGPEQAITSSVILIQPGQTYRYSLNLASEGNKRQPGTAQVRLIWLDAALGVLTWDDSPAWQPALPDAGSLSEAFHTGAYMSPPGARALRFVIGNVAGEGTIVASTPKLSAEGVYVEPHPNGALGSLAFSFDWESAMGGAIHSKGMDPHDPKGAVQHGLEMRQGGDWLNDLFKKTGVEATFYGTGYNLLDGNSERRTFAGDPTYKWASPKNGWATDYWTTHKWYGDDPYGTLQSDPAWYFGDQTRALLGAGHEIAPHTFGHLYVRGTTPAELGTDIDEWLKYAKSLGITAATTFAFPWRSSNSLTRDFYDTLHRRGIRAVTRLYERDLRDLYTLGAAYGRDNGTPWVYEDMAVMPDFLLGSPSAAMGEENAGGAVSREEGLQVISRTLESRGTTSFWQHPEQLANTPELAGVRQAWTQVVEQAASERDKGKLWIAPVAYITEYQHNVMSVTTSLESSFLGGWTIRVNNNSGQTLSGVTLTLPGEVRSTTSDSVHIKTVSRTEDGKVRLGEAGQGTFPTRQIVLDDLEPIPVTINIEWAPGQEPAR